MWKIKDDDETIILIVHENNISKPLNLSFSDFVKKQYIPLQSTGNAQKYGHNFGIYSCEISRNLNFP